MCESLLFRYLILIMFLFIAYQNFNFQFYLIIYIGNCIYTKKKSSESHKTFKTIRTYKMTNLKMLLNVFFGLGLYVMHTQLAGFSSHSVYNVQYAGDFFFFFTFQSTVCTLETFRLPLNIS